MHGYMKYSVEHIVLYFEIIISVLINTHPGCKATTLILHRNKMQTLACQLSSLDSVCCVFK